nr:reverse transcriptase domain-containing protein [Tanacetum cinerariifolium]
MLTVCPKVLNQGSAVPSHEEKEVRKEKRCLKGWRRVYSTDLETRRRVCPHTREIQGIGHTTAAAETLKADIEVFAPEKQNLILRNIITNEHPHEEQKRCQKVWVVQEDIGNPFTLRICYFDFPKTQMPSHIKTYDKSEDREDHLKVYQAAIKAEQWAMLTWCHTFNSTLTGNARMWFEDLSKEYIDNYDDLKEAFLENYLYRKKCIKYPLEIHNIKPRDGESTKDFIRIYKLKCRDVKGALEYMKISGFVHEITNPDLIRRLHDKIPKFRPEVRRQMIPATTPLVRFSGEIIWLLRQISLPVKIGDEEHSTSAWMNFMIDYSIRMYNGLGTWSTIARNKPSHKRKNPGLPQLVINQVTKEKIQVAINPEYPEQTNCNRLYLDRRRAKEAVRSAKMHP